MNYEDVLKRLSPCGLDCGRCAEYEYGEIKDLSGKLLVLLENYEKRVAKMKAEVKPEFKDYQRFREILDSFAGGSCGGCRSNNACFIDCRAKTCHREKGVDFCFQCGEFPCDQQFSGALRERWIKNNRRMNEIGAAEFYQEQLKSPRY